MQDASKQSQQFQQMVDDKVDVILAGRGGLQGHREDVQKAKDAGIPVIAYDRLAQGPIDAYISFDNELVGEVQGKALSGGAGHRRRLEEDRHDERLAHRPERGAVQVGRPG